MKMFFFRTFDMSSCIYCNKSLWVVRVGKSSQNPPAAGPGYSLTGPRPWYPPRTAKGQAGSRWQGLRAAKILKHPKVSFITHYSTLIPPAAGPGLRLHSQTAHGSCSQASSKVASTTACVCSPIPARQTCTRQVS